jgi:hypothetical protein
MADHNAVRNPGGPSQYESSTGGTIEMRALCSECSCNHVYQSVAPLAGQKTAYMKKINA